ncbi:MAG: ZmpA/ZmpB/ZmpC family metallo-endopeptidase-related protein [Rikenellaceae bacterium]
MLLAFSACEESEDIDEELQAQIEAEAEAKKGSIENIAVTDGDGNTISDTTPISLTNGDNYTIKLKAILMNDISLAGEEWTPIPAFKGTFDGNSHTISNLTINSSDSYQGLFATINGATITDLTLKDPKVTGSDSVGAICGSATEGATILRCHIDGGTISGDDERVGGVVGYCYVTVTTTETT